MKNIFDLSTKEELLARIDKLVPNAPALWGKMDVNQSMRHISMGLDIATGRLDATPSRVPPMPKWLMKFFLLNTKPPKEKAETFTEINMVANNINPTDFEAERNNLKAAIESFYNATTLLPVNKIGGKFSKTDWGKLSYNHADHHLRQFGV